MSILLLGRDGQVGWQLQRSLAPHGEVLACGRRECDLADLSGLRSLVRRVQPSVIVNAAACTAVDRAEAEPELAMLHQGQAMADDEQRLYHLCCGRPVSWHEFATTIVALAGAMPGARAAPDAGGDPPHADQ